jgi:hypothetical protein
MGGLTQWTLFLTNRDRFDPASGRNKMLSAAPPPHAVETDTKLSDIENKPGHADAGTNQTDNQPSSIQ